MKTLVKIRIMQERHKDRKQYFNEQGITTSKYVIPYISEFKSITDKIRILEIGCGEGGNLIPFVEIGCEVVGVDLNSGQIGNAREFISEHYQDSKVDLLNQNIYDIGTEDIGSFDIVMLRDVIEHIPNQDKFLKHLKSFLKPDGIVFFGFPPWCMPFGGHQQICRSKLLSKTPYFHLLPVVLYKLVLKLFGETEGIINSLLEIKETGIGINRFQRIVAKNGYKFLKKTFYLINPNYEVKFGLKQRTQFKIVQAIPYFRDFLTTCLYSVIKMDNTSPDK